MKLVYVSADICGTGIEVKQHAGADLVMTAPRELGLSQPLCFHLHAWQKWFDGVFDLTDEHIQRLVRLGSQFDQAGFDLAKRVAQELGPEHRVIYEPQGGWRLNENGEPLPCVSMEVMGFTDPS